MEAKATDSVREILEKLVSYYKHQQELLRGFEKDQTKLDEGLREIQEWIDEVEEAIGSFTSTLNVDRSDSSNRKI